MVVIIGLVTLTALVGGLVLSYQAKSVGDFVVATVAGGLGALGALLAKTGLDALSEGGSVPVTVQNEPADPVPVDPGV